MATLFASLAISPGSQARDLAVVNYGGTTGAALQEAFMDPFAQKSGIKIVNIPYNGEQAKIKAMVQANNVVWDVIDSEPQYLVKGCEEDYYEKIDWSKLLNVDDFIPGAVMECGVGIYVVGIVMAYNKEALPNGPKNWADFWNVKDIPGKRALRKVAQGNLEYALMADGVAPEDVYPMLETSAGVDRAFAKLDEIKDHIVWWEAGAQPVQMLASNDVIMSSAYNGRIDAAKEEGYPLDVVWNEGIFETDYWVIPKGSSNKQLAIDFVQFASSPEAQAELAKRVTYGPTNKKTMDLLDDSRTNVLPTSPKNSQNVLYTDAAFWLDHGEELEQRFTAWAAR